MALRQSLEETKTKTLQIDASARSEEASSTRNGFAEAQSDLERALAA